MKVLKARRTIVREREFICAHHDCEAVLLVTTDDCYWRTGNFSDR